MQAIRQIEKRPLKEIFYNLIDPKLSKPPYGPVVPEIIASRVAGEVKKTIVRDQRFSPREERFEHGEVPNSAFVNYVWGGNVIGGYIDDTPRNELYVILLARGFPIDRADFMFYARNVNTPKNGRFLRSDLFTYRPIDKESGDEIVYTRRRLNKSVTTTIEDSEHMTSIAREIAGHDFKSIPVEKSGFEFKIEG